MNTKKKTTRKKTEASERPILTVSDLRYRIATIRYDLERLIEDVDAQVPADPFGAPYEDVRPDTERLLECKTFGATGLCVALDALPDPESEWGEKIIGLALDPADVQRARREEQERRMSPKCKALIAELKNATK